MKKTKLLTSIAALALVVSLGACETGDVIINVGDVGTSDGSSSDTTGTDTSEEDEDTGGDTSGEPGEGSNPGSGSDDDNPEVIPPITYDYTITYEGDGFVFAFLLPDGANEGDEIYFKLLTESGYAIDSVVASYLDEENEDVSIVLEGDETEGYTFTMPAGDVTIKAVAIGAFFILSYNGNENVYTTHTGSGQRMYDVLYGFYEPYTGEKISSATSNYVRAGTEILVVGNHPSYADELIFYANGEELEMVTDPEVSAGMYAFWLTMPGEDTVITASIDTLKYVNVTLEEDERVNAYLYTMPEDGDDIVPLTRLEGLRAGADNFYLHVELNEEYVGSYEIENINLSYERYSEVYEMSSNTRNVETAWTSNNSNTSNGFVKYDDNTRYTLTPGAAYVDNEITVSLTFKDLTKYKDEAFVGDYVGYEVEKGKANSIKYTLNINGAGEFTSSSSAAGGVTISSIAADGKNMVLSDGRACYADGKVAIYNYNASTYNVVNDSWVFVKDVETVTYEFKVFTTSYEYLYAIYGDGALIEYVYTDYYKYQGSEDRYYDVQVEFSEGSSISDSSSKYTIKTSDGTLIREVS